MTQEPTSVPPPAPAPVQAPYAAPPSPDPLCIASLACGIVAVLICWIPFVGFIGLLLGVGGLVTGIIGLKRPYGRGLAIGGIVGSSIAIAIWIIGVVLFGVLITALAHAH